MTIKHRLTREQVRVGQEQKLRARRIPGVKARNVGPSVEEWDEVMEDKELTDGS